MCNAINELATRRDSKRAGSFVSHVTPRVQAKLVKLVGDKCKVRCSLNEVETECFYDTCAQICLLSDDWLKLYLPTAVVKPVKEILDDHEIVIKAANDTDIPYLGYVEMDFRLKSWNNDTTLSVPFFVTSEKIAEPIIGFNVITEISKNPEEYGMQEEDLALELKKSMEGVQNMDTFVNLIQTQTTVDLCNIKTAKRGIKLPAGKNGTLKCYANTGPIDSRRPVIFEPDPQPCWPDGLEVSESILSLRKGGSCHVSIPVSNTTSQDIYLPPRTNLGSLQLVSSITPLDVQLVKTPDIVDEKPLNDKPERAEPTIAEPSKQFLPEVDLAHLNEKQRETVETMLKEECASFSRSDQDIGCVPEVQMNINLSDKRPVQKR